MKHLTNVFTLLIGVFAVSSCQFMPDILEEVKKGKATPRYRSTVAEIAQEDDELTMLVDALVKAELVETLNGEGPFTVFAPTNEAFEAAGIDLETIDQETLTAVLLYHVAAAFILEKNLHPGALTTLGGEAFISRKDGNVFINGNTGIEDANIIGKNGVVHKINEVLLPPSLNIAELASEADMLSSLVAAAARAELVSTLAAGGPFTVFAPTNAAFSEFLGDAALEDLTPEQVAAVLLYHVVEGRAFAADLRDGEITAFDGETISVEVNDDHSIVLNGEVNVISANNLATNGVVHIIDQVLEPVSLPNIVELAAGDPRFSELVKAVKKAGLVDALSGEGPLTVFAPTNRAFHAFYEANGVSGVEELSPEALTNVLTYHVAAARVFAADLPNLDNGEVPTLNGNAAFVSLVKKGPFRGAFINGDTKIIATDFEASNGVVHAINSVLEPPVGNIAETAIASAPEFTTLVAALQATGLDEVLTGDGPFTVFAPTNAAFEKLPEGTVEFLLKEENKDILTNILLYHVIPTRAYSADLFGVNELETAFDEEEVKVIITRGAAFVKDENDLSRNAHIEATDITATNGVIHVINQVLLPDDIFEDDDDDEGDKRSKGKGKKTDD